MGSTPSRTCHYDQYVLRKSNKKNTYLKYDRNDILTYNYDDNIDYNNNNNEYNFKFERINNNNYDYNKKDFIYNNDTVVIKNIKTNKYLYVKNNRYLFTNNKNQAQQFIINQ